MSQNKNEYVFKVHSAKSLVYLLRITQIIIGNLAHRSWLTQN